MAELRPIASQASHVNPPPLSDGETIGDVAPFVVCALVYGVVPSDTSGAVVGWASPLNKIFRESHLNIPFST